MDLPADFSKIFGSTATGGLTPISDVNYAKGWEFVGANPPTKNDFSYLQNLSDLKSQWLYSNKLQRANPFGDIKSDGAAAIAAALANLGLREAANRAVGNSTNQIPDMSFFTLSMGQSGYQKLPSGTIFQWGVVAMGSDGNAFATLPIAFPNGIHGGLAGEAAPTGWASNSCVVTAFDLAQSSRNGVTIRARAITGTNGPSASTATLSARYFCWGN